MIEIDGHSFLKSLTLYLITPNYKYLIFMNFDYILNYKDVFYSLVFLCKVQKSMRHTLWLLNKKQTLSLKEGIHQEWRAPHWDCPVCSIKPSSPSLTIMTLSTTVIDLIQQEVDEVSLLHRKQTKENNHRRHQALGYTLYKPSEKTFFHVLFQNCEYLILNVYFRPLWTRLLQKCSVHFSKLITSL